MKKISTNIHLDADLSEWLHQEAKRRHCSISQVIRDWIVQAMKETK